MTYNRFIVFGALLASQLVFSQYMVVGSDSVSLKDFKAENLENLQTIGVEKTLKSTQDFLLLQQIAKANKVDTTRAFRQRMNQTLAELREKHFYPESLKNKVLSNFVQDSKTERSVLVFTVEKSQLPFYQTVYNQVVSGQITMQQALRTHLGSEQQPLYLKPGVVGHQMYADLKKLTPGTFTKLYDQGESIMFAQLVATRPSLGYMIFGSLGIDPSTSSQKKQEILSQLRKGVPFNEITAKYGTTENEKNNGGVVLGSPTLPDAVYKALAGKTKGYFTTEPVVLAEKHFYFYIYDVVPYELNPNTRALFQREMMASNYQQLLEEELVALEKASGKYRESPAFAAVRTSFSGLKNTKNPSTVLVSYNGKDMTAGALLKQISQQVETPEKLTAEQWKKLLEMNTNSFVFQHYNVEFLSRPEVLTPLQQQRKMLYSEYIFTDYLRKQVEDNPSWVSEYYAKNKDKYLWEAHGKGRVAIVSDPKLVGEIKSSIKDPKQWEALKKRYEQKVDSKGVGLVHFEQGEMSKEADIFTKHQVPFTQGVHSAQLGERTVVVALDQIVAEKQMSLEESKDYIKDALTQQRLEQTLSLQRSSTKIIVDKAFMADLEKNFKK